MDWATFGAAISVSLVGGGLISAIVAWRLGLLQLLNQRTMHEHRVEMDVWDRLQKSYETEIEQLEKVGDTEKSERRRFEYAEQQAAWRAQQGVSAIAPIEVRPEGGSTLTSDELEKLGKLLAASRPLDPAALSAQDYFLRGNSYYNAGEYQVALSAYNRSLELRPDDPAILSNRGAVLGNLGRYEEALADVNRSLELRPDDPSTLNNRSGALSHLGRYEEALADVSRAQDLRPDHPLTLNNRGITLHRLNRYEEALADYNRSLELQPNEPSTLGNRGNTLADMERYGDALADYNRSLELWPDEPCDFIQPRPCIGRFRSL